MVTGKNGHNGTNGLWRWFCDLSVDPFIEAQGTVVAMG